MGERFSVASAACFLQGCAPDLQNRWCSEDRKNTTRCPPEEFRESKNREEATADNCGLVQGRGRWE